MCIRTRPRNVVVFITVAMVLPYMWISLFSGGDRYEALLERRFAELRERLQFAELLNKQRENDIHILRSQFTFLLDSFIHGNVSTNRTNSVVNHFPQEVQSMLTNYSDMYGRSGIYLPSIFTYLPNLVGHPESMVPAYKASKNRFGVSIVIGIPHIKREKTNYLIPTLKSLVDGLNQEEKEDCLIVVFIAEPKDKPYVQQVAQEIKTSLPASVESGLIEIISPPDSFYPNLDNLRETLGDSQERVKWRTKQNLDFSFMMLYGRNRGYFYVQLEDDVVAKPGYVSIMKSFAHQQKNDDWVLLEFSALGFIGKMFKSSDVPMIVDFFLMFHLDKPIDWLLDHLLFVKVCNPEKDNKHCTRMKADLRRRYKPSLFQHVGVQSSLKGKVQKLKDKDFGKQGLMRAHINPDAEVSTSLSAYQQFTLRKAYLGETFFWATDPKVDDYVEFHFKTPTIIESYLFRSGNADHPGDRFYNTTVLVMPVSNTNQPGALLKNAGGGGDQTDSAYTVVGTFNKEGLAEGNIPDSIKEVEALRLHLSSKSENWVILSEIFIKVKGR